MNRAALIAPNGNEIVDKNDRVQELVANNRTQWLERGRIRDIMNNRRALAALLGNTIKDPNARLPIANLMLRANTALATKLGRPSSTKVDPSVMSDSDLARKRADKLARIVASHDEICSMDMLLPQVGRWLPGYGFSPAVIKTGRSRFGDPYPTVELRDPFQSFPGEWGAGQHPVDIAFAYVCERKNLAKQFPDHAAAIMAPARSRAAGGAVLLDLDSASSRGPGWLSQSGNGVEVYEYYDERGCWWLLPESNLLLSYEPNLLSEPSFAVAKRFCFDELVGALDHAIGVMADMTRLSLLATIAVEDGVMAETNIIGDLRSDKYRRGRNSVNIFSHGTTVAKMNSQVPFQTFQQIDRAERQLRVIAGHSPMEDGESALDFATGKGLQELRGSSGLEVREYQTAIANWKKHLNALRLEHDEVVCDQDKTMYGVRGGSPFVEKYRPSKDIAGNYLTREVHGAMAGFDDATKIITGLQLLQGDVIDMDTMRENLDGLENLDRIEERIRAGKVEKVVMEGLLANIADERVRKAAIKMLPQGDMRSILEEIFAEPEQEAAAPPPVAMPEQMPDVQTVLSRLQGDGSVESGSQLVQRVA